MNDQVTPQETAKILELAQSCLGVAGDFVELGCYRGETTLLLGKLLAKTTPDKKLWAYDSFEGLPEKTAQDLSGAGANFQGGELAVSKREVAEKLRRAGLRNVILKKTWFDHITPDILPEKVAFAFIDGDFYASQKIGLELISPLLQPQGIIICHDYNNPELPGASRAVDEFLHQNPAFRLQIFQSLAILHK